MRMFGPDVLVSLSRVEDSRGSPAGFDSDSGQVAESLYRQALLLSFGST
ncbi:hypothetical protein AB0H00_13750 [Nocardia sp. NPDC023852]